MEFKIFLLNTIGVYGGCAPILYRYADQRAVSILSFLYKSLKILGEVSEWGVVN